MKLEGYSNYEIYPETGKIYSYRTNRYIGSLDKDGYYVATLTSDTKQIVHKSIHRLIWVCVNGEIPEGMQVNHINEDKSDNRICNLNLMTQTENNNWGTGNYRRSLSHTNHPKKSKPIIGLRNGKIQKYFPSIQEAKRNGFNPNSIINCCRNEIYSYEGYKWIYLDNYIADWWEWEMEKGA